MVVLLFKIQSKRENMSHLTSKPALSRNITNPSPISQSKRLLGRWETIVYRYQYTRRVVVLTKGCLHDKRHLRRKDDHLFFSALNGENMRHPLSSQQKNFNKSKRTSTKAQMTSQNQSSCSPLFCDNALWFCVILWHHHFDRHTKILYRKHSSSSSFSIFSVKTRRKRSQV